MEYTISYAANIAVRAFLLNQSRKLQNEFIFFERGNRSKYSQTWNDILVYFDYRCVYCYAHKESSLLEVEHLYPMNRTECGLQIKNNVAPCCSACNNGRDNSKIWIDKLHLKQTDISIRTELEIKLRTHIGKYEEFRIKENHSLQERCIQLYDSIGEKFKSLI